MRRLAYTTLLAFSVILFATCEKFEVKPLTKVETGTATPQATTITVNAKIIDLSGEGNDDHGFCYATHSEPTIDDGKVSKGSPKVGKFTGSIDGLTLNNQYYIRAYCSSTEGVVYGKVVAISTLDGQSALTTTSVTGITATSAVSGGNITSDGGAAITARGLVWSTSQNPTVETNNGITSNGTGTGKLTSNLTNLQPQTLYYVRAYATNSIGTVYGNQQTFTTQDGTIVLTTAAATSITATTAVSGGNITSDGGAAITARGLVWSTSQNPTVETNNGITSNGTGTGSFTSNLTNLQPQTLYYVRAYATNSLGTSYGDEQTFTTQDGLPVLTTTSVTGITATTAVSGGNITSDGGFPVTARGVVWSTSQNPTVETNNGITSNGTGTGSFTSNLTNLQPQTLYYVRAYATNSLGTSYGDEQTFTTQDGLPVLTTTSVTGITATTAVSGGNITSDGGFPVTARGVVWSTSQNPTVETNNGITSNGTGTGSFTSNLTNLQPQTLYYVRAYATNSYGTQYGNQVSFTTPMPDGPGGTITDADGNTYNTIWINGRQWMKENLKTTKYNDGTSIPLVTDDAAWVALSTPAYCWYNNDQTTYGNTYGALYNWYAVSTTTNGGKNVCPTGWHVPTDAEWYAMENYVDPTINNPSATGWRGTDGGTKLKATSGWISGGNGTDIYGFSALPGGYRYYGNGTFDDVGRNGYWWSSTEHDATNAWYRHMYYDLGNVNRRYTNKRDGFSVRCVRD